jgi:hypothetical protein
MLGGKQSSAFGGQIKATENLRGRAGLSIYRPFSRPDERPFPRIDGRFDGVKKRGLRIGRQDLASPSPGNLRNLI